MSEPDHGPQGRGNLYFCVKVPIWVCKKGEIYIWADEWDMVNGHLIFYLLQDGEPKNMVRPKRALNMAFAPGQWNTVFAASVLDGNAIAVEHWEGEVER